VSNVITMPEGKLRLSLMARRREERRTIAKCGSHVCAELGVCVGGYYFDNQCKDGDEERS
jgi:hypothetical protein